MIQHDVVATIERPLSTEVAERSADPAEYVIQACERAKAWLSDALEHGDISEIIELKSQAEAIRVYTAQKNLGKDAELSAAEIVRRAERGIGLAIRRGQEAGEIRKPGDDTRVDLGHRGNDVLTSPKSFFQSSKENLDAYAMAAVPDAHFEQAIEEAKGERNMSRANVARKVKGTPPKPEARSEYHRKRLHIRIERVVEETLIALEGLSHGLALVDIDEATDEQRDAWSHRFHEAIRPINRFFREV